MNDLHIYCESVAVGDAALNLCRIKAALDQCGYDNAIIYTAPFLRVNNFEIPTNPNVRKIWDRTNFVKETKLLTETSELITENPMFCNYYNDIREWVDLKDFTPDFSSDKKTAIFQPISLRTKPKEYINDYIPVWDRCIKTLLKKDYLIIIVGAKDDPIDLCINKDVLPYMENKCGKWSILEAVAYTMYKADAVVSCDSWAGIWGAASRKPSVIAWGYRMENNIDFWVSDFLGNKDIYKYGWSSQKEYCDALLAAYLSSKI